MGWDRSSLTDLSLPGKGRHRSVFYNLAKSRTRRVNIEPVTGFMKGSEISENPVIVSVVPILWGVAI